MNEMREGILCLQNGLYTKAVEIFLESLYEDPQDIDALTNIGIAYTEMGENEKSIKALNYVIKLDADNIEAMEALGCAHYRLGCYESAKHYFNKALTLNAKASSVLRNLGLTYLITQEYENGYNCLKKSVKLNPLDYKSQYGFASACIKIGRYRDAHKILTGINRQYVPEKMKTIIEKEIDLVKNFLQET